jgi:hypothetical protein
MYSSACRPKVSRLKICLDTFKKHKTEIHNNFEPDPIFNPAKRENLSPTSICFLVQKYYISKIL